MNNAECKAKLFDMIISGKGLPYIMDACAEILQNPFVFVNRSLQLVSKCTLCDQYPNIFGWFTDPNGENLRVAHEANKAGYFQAIYSSDAPVYGTISGIPVNWIAARVRLKSQILGNILVPDCQTQFTETYQELLPLICQTIAYALRQSDNNGSFAPNYEALLMDLLSGENCARHEETAIRDKFKLLGCQLPEKMRVLIVRRSSTERTMSHVVLDAQLRSQFPTSIGIVYKNDCIRVLDARLSEEEIEARILEYLDVDQITLGISRCYSSVTSLHDACLQASAAVRLGPTHVQKRLYTFDDVIGAYLYEQVLSTQSISKEGLIMEEIEVLLDSRGEGGAERIQDLAAYLSCGRNVTRTAQMRGLHKNSMYYRLDRIAEMTNLDLSNDDVCVQLTLALTLLGYLPYRCSF